MKKMPSGYGMIVLSAMQDQNLTIEAKAIYSLLCAYTGVKDCCFPKVQTICKSLKISKTRFYKHMELLLKYGYVKKDKLYDDMRNNNKYFLMFPDDQCPENKDNQCPENKDVASPLNDDIINSNTINNNIINSFDQGLEYRREMKSMFEYGAKKLNQHISFSVKENSTLKTLYERLESIETDMELKDFIKLFMRTFYEKISRSKKDYWKNMLYKPCKALASFDEIITEINKNYIEPEENKIDLTGVFK